MSEQILDENAPFGLKAGDWIVCANEHKNWKVQAELDDKSKLSANLFTDPDGKHPTAGTKVAVCRDCGEALIVNGNQGLRFRVLRSVPVEVDA